MNALVVDSSVGQRAALALQQLDDGVADLVDLRAVQSLEHRAQSAEQRIEVECGLGVLPRNRAARRNLAQFPWPRGDLEIAVTDQVLVADHRTGRRVELIALVDVERDVDGVVGVQLDASTLPTGTPAIRTSCPAFSREASVNVA